LQLRLEPHCVPVSNMEAVKQPWTLASALSRIRSSEMPRQSVERVVMPNASQVSAQTDAAFTCEVCFELCSDRLPLSKLKTGNGDVLREADCGHNICRECMASYVVARVDEQRVFDLRCPHEGCKNELYEQDLGRLSLPVGVAMRFNKLRTADYSQRAKELKAILRESCSTSCVTEHEMFRAARLCPRCSVVLQKSAGCNSFYCICGHHFKYDKAPLLMPANYTRVLYLGRTFKMTFDEAEACVGRGLFKASRTALQMGVSLDEAKELQRRAQGGDETARAQIRAARQKP